MMKKYQTYKLFRWKTVIIFMVCLTSIFILDLALNAKKYNHANNLVCRANIRIQKDEFSFRGIIDIKSSHLKGISNISGIIRKDDQTFIVNRTVLFTRSDYGVSPIWTSSSVIPSNQETAPENLLDHILPKFYIKHYNVTDVDIFPINANAYLITKEGIPYLYCQKSTIISDTSNQ